MNKAVLLKAATGLLFILYPFLIYLGLREFQPRALACLLIVAVALRLFTTKSNNDKNSTNEMTLYWAAAASLTILLTVVTGSEWGLFLYPLLINLAFLTFFALSLYKPPTVIERIARHQQPDLPEEAIAYTRNVTKAWCLFFILNGAMSMISAMHSTQWWMLYNGFISYILIGMMLLVEYLIRLTRI